MTETFQQENKLRSLFILKTKTDWLENEIQLGCDDEKDPTRAKTNSSHTIPSSITSTKATSNNSIPLTSLYSLWKPSVTCPFHHCWKKSCKICPWKDEAATTPMTTTTIRSAPKTRWKKWDTRPWLVAEDVAMVEARKNWDLISFLRQRTAWKNHSIPPLPVVVPAAPTPKNADFRAEENVAKRLLPISPSCRLLVIQKTTRVDQRLLPRPRERKRKCMNE